MIETTDREYTFYFQDYFYARLRVRAFADIDGKRITSDWLYIKLTPEEFGDLRESAQS